MPDANDGQQHLSAPGWRTLPDDRDEAMAALRQHFASGGELLGDAPGAVVPEVMLQPVEALETPDPEPPDVSRQADGQPLAQILEKLTETPVQPETTASNESVVLGQVLRIFEVQRAAIDEVISVIERQIEV